ncbi:MAG: DUF5050 domain-containing protein [Oscillospiraceae bacterium]|nr:DUF5050 domain-containing protein [Oscillospiraceae bacterium]
MAVRAKGNYNPGDVVLGNWKLNHLIGEGSLGKVYEARREDFGRLRSAAVKIISAPTGQIEELLDEIDEFSIMANLKGNGNIVGYDDREIVGDKNGAACDVILRMELLTPFLEYAHASRLAVRNIIQLGIDVCAALETAQKFNIAHKNIKPENIFASKLGGFMLGDFALSRTAGKIASGLPKKGAYAYVAPELYLGDPCGANADIYSLGIVLYRMLNDNRTPFLPDYPAQISGSVYKEAVMKRVRGASLPEPKNASGRLAEIILKACAYAPKDRYASPGQMKDELESILYTQEEAVIAYPRGDLIQAKPLEYLEEDDIPFSESIVWEAAPRSPEKNEKADEFEDMATDPAPKTPKAPLNPKKRGWKSIMLFCAAILALLAGGTYFAILALAKPEKNPGETERPDIGEYLRDGAESAGNTPGNIANGGYAAISGDFIYYSNGNDNWTLYSVKTNGSGKAKLNDDKSYGINVSGGVVHYINASDNKAIYAINTDGTGKRKLDGDEASNLNVSGDFIYYTNESDNGAIYAINTDGTGKKKLDGDKASGISVSGDFIYYTNESDNGTIYAINTDGTGKRKLCDDWYARYMNVSGGFIYYSNTGDNKRLYAAKTDGTGAYGLNDDGSHNINVAGDLIFYSNISDGGKIYMIKAETGEKCKLNDDDSQNINVVGDRIYYVNISDNYKMYSMNLDGSGRKAID